MKSTGIVRKVDNIGRVLIPKVLRHTLGIKENDSLEIFVDGDQIMLKKYIPGCNFCGSTEIERTLYGKMACRHCIAQLKGNDSTG